MKKFIDEVFQLYKNKLSADDEDIDLLTASLMQELSREDMLLLLSELNYQELFQITGNYIADELRKRMIREESQENITSEKSPFLH